MICTCIWCKFIGIYSIFLCEFFAQDPVVSYVQGRRNEGHAIKKAYKLILIGFSNSLLYFVLSNILVRRVAPCSLKSLLKKKHLIR